MVLCGASVAPVFCETANNSSILDCREPQLKAINPIDIETLPTLQNLHRRGHNERHQNLDCDRADASLLLLQPPIWLIPNPGESLPASPICSIIGSVDQGY
jgi:hypothetical protein